MTQIPSHDLRREVHAILDPLWETAPQAGGYAEKKRAFMEGHGGKQIRKIARRRVYAWLAEQMWLTEDECHVQKFTVAQCQDAIRHLQAITYAEIRIWAQGRKEVSLSPQKEVAQ